MEHGLHLQHALWEGEIGEQNEETLLARHLAPLTEAHIALKAQGPDETRKVFAREAEVVEKSLSERGWEWSRP
jgi:hypothetical protein